ELLYLFDGKKFAFGNYFENLTISKVNERYFLKTLIGGEKYSIDKHGFKGVVVKAMTYHMMSIEKIDNLWKLQYVVDI
ncbi:MAG: archease, partial [Thermoprotei archaeon ex4572_64]